MIAPTPLHYTITNNSALKEVQVALMTKLTYHGTQQEGKVRGVWEGNVNCIHTYKHTYTPLQHFVWFSEFVYVPFFSQTMKTAKRLFRLGAVIAGECPSHRPRPKTFHICFPSSCFRQLLRAPFPRSGRPGMYFADAENHSSWYPWWRTWRNIKKLCIVVCLEVM